MEYITLGTDKLLEEYFYQVINSDRKIKPIGGLWCSKYYSTYNEWLDYLTRNPRYYYRYTLGNNPFRMDAAVLKLCDDAKVFNVDSKDAATELEKKYKYDFEKLSLEYDALSVNPFGLYDYGTHNDELFRRVYAIQSLDVFDLSKVESYKKAVIDIEPFDYTYSGNRFINYETKVDPEDMSVYRASEEYNNFLEWIFNKLKDYIFRLRLEYPDFPPNKIVYLVKEEIDRVIGPDLAEYAKRNELNQERLAYSLSTKTYRRVK